MCENRESGTDAIEHSMTSLMCVHSRSCFLWKTFPWLEDEYYSTQIFSQTHPITPIVKVMKNYFNNYFKLIFSVSTMAISF